MKTLYIIRGLPGSGKSTLARKLVDPHRHFEADAFHVNADGVYFFDPLRVKDAHAWCQQSVWISMEEYPDDIAVSNTFTQRWEYQTYLDMAASRGFEVQVIDCHGPWVSEHNVPEPVMEAMRRRWEPHVINNLGNEKPVHS